MAMIMTPRIITSDCGPENLLKSRCLKLAPKNCLAIGLQRVLSPVISSPTTTNTSSSSPSSLPVSSSSSSSSSTSPTSSLSVASDVHPSQSPPPPPPPLPVSTCEGDNTCSEQLQVHSTTPSPTSPPSDRRHQLVKSPQPSLESGHLQQQQHQLEPIDRQSFSSIGTDTTTSSNCVCGQAFNTADLFTDFLRENLPLLNSYFCSQLLPPPSASVSLSKLDLVGFIYPSTLLVGGHQDALHLLSALWSRRILRAPTGYAIRFIGYTSASVEVTTISQAQFTPLAEALHRVVDELNHSLNLEATFEAVVRQLKREFPGMELPSDELLRSSLSGLVAEHKLAFDAVRGLYSATRPLLTPNWDEFEHLTLMTNSEATTGNHFKGGLEEEIEIELKGGNGSGSVHAAESLVNRCTTSTTMEANSEYFHQHLKGTGSNSSKSATLSSAGNSSDGTPLEQYLRENGDSKAKLHRRNSSSLSNNDIGQQQADSNSTGNLELSNRKGAAIFKRSKSLRITSKRSTENGGQQQQQQQLPKDCTCSSEIIIKRQSLFSKILKFGQNSSNGGSLTGSGGSNHLKSRSASACSVKSAHFGSQFPEVTATATGDQNGGASPYAEQQQQVTTTTKSAELTSVATQTVKCGSEDMVTLILKQAGRHALARSRSCGGGGQRSVERYANENSGRCLCSSPRHHHYHYNYRESSRNGRRSNGGSNRNGYHTTKYYLIGENENTTTAAAAAAAMTEMSLKCQCNLAEHLSFADSTMLSNGSHNGRHNHHQQPQQNHNHPRNHHRSKHRSASLRASQQHQHQHYRPNEWLIDYTSGNGNNNHHHYHNNTTRKGVERTRAQRQLRNGRGHRSYLCQQSADEDEEEEEEEENEVENDVEQHNGDGSHSQAVHYPKINGHWLATANGSQLQQQQKWPLTSNGEDRHAHRTLNGGSNTTTTNLLINNSLNLKIEIETSSSRMPPPQQQQPTVSSSAGAHPHHQQQQQQPQQHHHLSSSESSSQQASAAAAAVTFSRQLLQQAKILEESTSGHYNSHHHQQQNQQQHQQHHQPYHHQFANDIYSELTFDRHTHRLSQIQSVNKQRLSQATPVNHHQFRPLPVPPSLPSSPPPPFSASSLDYQSGSSYNSDLNYSNSITALKEQIARAKANFFSVPLSSNGAAVANSATAATTTSTR